MIQNIAWQTKKLGEIFEIARGGSPRPIEKYLTNATNGINWIKIGDTKEVTKYIYKTKEKITPEGVRRSRLVNKGDFILSNSMSFGRPYIMKTSGCIHDGWLVLKEKEKNINQDYLYYVLSSQLIFNQFDTLAAGSTVRNLNIDLVKRVEIPLPPINDQHRIVKILDETFTAIAKAKENAEKNLQNARGLFEAYLQNVFANTKNEWEEKILGKVCEIENERNIKKNIIYVGMEDIESNTGRFLGQKEPRNVKSATFYFTKEHLLYGRLRPYLNKVLLPDFEGHCSTEIFPLKVTELLNKEYLFYWITSKQVVKRINETCTGTRMPRADMKEILDFPIALPPLPDQKRIVEKLDALSAETKKLEAIYQQKLAALEELKKSLLQKAFAGEL